MDSGYQKINFPGWKVDIPRMKIHVPQTLLYECQMLVKMILSEKEDDQTLENKHFSNVNPGYQKINFSNWESRYSENENSRSANVTI